MLIDPFTVIAQIVNFAILVVALKYLLYDRVIDAMDRREASIASRLAEADEREAVATEEAERLRRERAQLDQDRHELMDRARDEAAEHRTELVDRARAEVNDDRRRWQRGLQAEQREFRRELERRTAHEVMELGRRALFDLADARLEAAVLDRALDHLEAQTEVRDVIVTGEGPLTVRTAFEVPDAERDEIIQRLRAMDLPADRQVRFELEPDLLLGVELRGDGTAISWNATDYVDRLAASVEELAAHVDDTGHED